MKYRHLLLHYERNLHMFQHASPPRMFHAFDRAREYASQLRLSESQRRNGRPRTVAQIEKRRRKRSHDLAEEWEQGRFDSLLPTYPIGMPCSVRCGSYYYPYEIIHGEPGKVTVQKRIPNEQPPLQRVMTFRLLRKRRNGTWFGLWVEEGESCKNWHRLNKSVHLNVNLDTSQGRFTSRALEPWNYRPESRCWLQTYARTYFPVPVE